MADGPGPRAGSPHQRWSRHRSQKRARCDRRRGNRRREDRTDRTGHSYCGCSAGSGRVGPDCHAWPRRLARPSGLRRSGASDPCDRRVHVSHLRDDRCGCRNPRLANLLRLQDQDHRPFRDAPVGVYQYRRPRDARGSVGTKRLRYGTQADGPNHRGISRSDRRREITDRRSRQTGRSPRGSYRAFRSMDGALRSRQSSDRGPTSRTSSTTDIPRG